MLMTKCLKEREQLVSGTTVEKQVIKINNTGKFSQDSRRQVIENNFYLFMFLFLTQYFQVLTLSILHYITQ